MNPERAEDECARMWREMKSVRPVDYPMQVRVARAARLLSVLQPGTPQYAEAEAEYGAARRTWMAWISVDGKGHRPRLDLNVRGA